MKCTGNQIHYIKYIKKLDDEELELCPDYSFLLDYNEYSFLALDAQHIEKFKNDKPNEKTGGGKLKMIDMTPNELNTQVKEALSFYSDNIMWNLYEQPEDAFYHGKKITNKRMKSGLIDP
jgi:hypothetical protein